MRHRRTPRPCGGFVLLPACLVLMTLLTLTAASFVRSLTDVSVANRAMGSQRAFYLADAGIDVTLVELISGGANFLKSEGWANAFGNDCVAGAPCFRTLQLGTGTATVQISDIATSPYTITSSSSVGGVPRTIQVILQVTPSSSASYALFGDQFMQLDKTTLVDSYDSSKGAYTPAPATGNRFANGDVGTNSINPNTLVLDQAVNVYGDAIVGPGGVPSAVIQLGGGAQVWGISKAATANQTLPPIVVPSGSPCAGGCATCTSLVVAGTKTVNVGSGSPFCYSSVTITSGKLIVNGTGQMTLGDPAATDLDVVGGKLQVNGNVTIVTGEANIASSVEVGSGGSVKLYATQSALLKDVINLSGRPKNFQLFYGGAGLLQASQGTMFYGTIYAPNADVQLDQKGGFFGSVTGKTVNVDQSGQIHYDESLIASSGGGTGSGLKILSWREL